MGIKRRQKTAKKTLPSFSLDKVTDIRLIEILTKPRNSEGKRIAQYGEAEDYFYKNKHLSKTLKGARWIISKYPGKKFRLFDVASEKWSTVYESLDELNSLIYMCCHLNHYQIFVLSVATKGQNKKGKNELP